MATKSRTSLGRVDHKVGRPKRTRQGSSKNSRPRGTRKAYRGQGR